ncbi:MAG: CAP domain-containing protein [Thermoleophilia bacterium]|nr:CAP domain-containing protein [Thermoleophilia bacterium]
MELRRSLPAAATVVALLALLAAEGAVGLPSRSLVASAKACPGSRSFEASPASQRAALVCLINYARRQAGLPRVHQSWMLSRVARAKGRDIVICRDFNHTACGKPTFSKFDVLGYRYRVVGENLFAAERPVGTARDAFVAWLNSPPHRHVLFLPRFSDAGVALFPLHEFQGSRRVRLWVLNLARRA